MRPIFSKRIYTEILSGVYRILNLRTRESYVGSGKTSMNGGDSTFISSKAVVTRIRTFSTHGI
jgi:hypothetical protein